MHLAEYYLGISKATSDELYQFLKGTIDQAMARKLPGAPLPEGFDYPLSGLLTLEEQGGFTFGYFDAALTNDGLKLIEAQALPTYHFSAAFIGSLLWHQLRDLNGSVFVNQPEATWADFLELKGNIVGGEAASGIVLADRELQAQKTNFDFYATQRELGLALDIVDSKDIFEREGRLFYDVGRPGSKPQQLHRLYSRVLALEALEDDGYPNNEERWRFRFDRSYDDFVLINHPANSFEISKHILPHVESPVNPSCFELSAVAQSFRDGSLGYSDFVWKHKWGVAGRGALLLPDAGLLDGLTEEQTLDEYIAQKKVDFEVFKTGDGEEKIVELRFMTVQSVDQLLVVPMARIGHVEHADDGRSVYRIHFGDNNRVGYGFCPVLIFDQL